MEGDGFWTDHASHAVQDLMQIVRCRLRRGVRPQGIDDHVAVQPVAGSEGKELYQRFGFTQPPMIFEGCPPIVTEKPPSNETSRSATDAVCFIAVFSRVWRKNEKGLSRRSLERPELVKGLAADCR